VTGIPTAQRQLIGAALRRHRERLGYGLQDAASILECHLSKISRIETGHRRIRPKELRELLCEYGASEPEIDALVAIARIGRGGNDWLDHMGQVLTPAAREYIQLEAAATQIQVWEPHQIPDLLQTTEYAAAIAAAVPGYPADQDPMMLAAVMAARQRAVLDERQPAFTAVIDQAALYRVVGGPDIMRSQMRHLAQAADDKRHSTVQVLPFSSGACAASIGGPGIILRFADFPGLGVIYLPRFAYDGASLVDQAELTRYTAAFTHLTKAALSPADSARLLRELAAVYGDAARHRARGQADFLCDGGADARRQP
jgi:transcriptional regulator with XRE-family HTH domain